MKKQNHLLNKTANKPAAPVSQNNDAFRDKVYKARIADNLSQVFTVETKLFEAKLIIDPRDGNLKLSNNPILLMHDMIKRNFDGSMEFINNLGSELSTPMNYCDEYIWIEKENGEIKGF